MSVAVDVTAATFATAVLEESRQRPVVVDFWAPWCGPCRTLGPILEQLAAQAHGAWVLAKINTDDDPALASQFQIQGIPAVKAFVNGRIVDEFTGVRPLPAVRTWLAGFVRDPSDDALDAARTALARGELEAAQAAFEVLRDRRPGPALAGLADVALARADSAAAAALLTDAKNLGPSTVPDAVVARLELLAEPGDPAVQPGVIAALANRWDDAFSMWMQVFRQGGSARAAALAAMRRGFRALERDPVADRWRTELTRALY